MDSRQDCSWKSRWRTGKKRNCPSPPQTHSSGRQNREDVRMNLKRIALVCILGLNAAGAYAWQGSTNVPDITGSWERARDASIPAQPQPPLKPQYLKEYQAKQAALREANQKGQPIADHV